MTTLDHSEINSRIARRAAHRQRRQTDEMPPLYSGKEAAVSLTGMICFTLPWCLLWLMGGLSNPEIFEHQSALWAANLFFRFPVPLICFSLGTMAGSKALIHDPSRTNRLHLIPTVLNIAGLSVEVMNLFQP